MAEPTSIEAFIDRHRRLFVLTGAGCSVSAGIPDYRDADGKWKRVPPVSYQAFMGEDRGDARHGFGLDRTPRGRFDLGTGGERFQAPSASR